MAFRDIDYSLRVNGDLSVPSHSLKVGSQITLTSADGTIAANKFSGDGSLITNLSSAAMTDVLLLNGSRTMTGALNIQGTGRMVNITASNQDTTLRMGDSNLTYGYNLTYTGTEGGVNNSLELWTEGSHSGGTPIKVFRVQQDGILRLSQDAEVAGNLNAAALKEAGTLLSAKYEAKGTLHDDRYYTEAEMDTKLSAKSNTGHTHSFSELTSKPTTLSGYGITDAATSTHHHNSQYAALVHNHDADYAAKTHSHAEYSVTSHNHDSSYTARGTRTQSVRALDKRTWTPTDISTGTGEFQFTFTALNNNNSSPYADGIVMSSYGDSSAGGNNMLLAGKDGSGLYLRYGGWNATDWSWTKKLAFDEDKANKTTSITAGTGLTGGGDLSATRTLAVNFGTAAGTVAAGNHTHAISGVTGLQSALDGKSATSHTHTFSSITSRPTTLSGYGITDAAPLNHNHDSEYLSLDGGDIDGALQFLGGWLTFMVRSNWGGWERGIFFENELGEELGGITAFGPNGSSLQYLEFEAGGGSFYITSDGKAWVGNDEVWHEGNFNPSDKADLTSFNSHKNDATIHKSWGNWSTYNNDMLVNGKRAVVNASTTPNKLTLNYANDFSDGVDVTGKLTNGGQQVWHAGNLDPSTYVGSGTGQSVGSGFAVKGRLLVGNVSGVTGDAIVYDGAGGATIHLDGNSSGIESSSATKIHLKGNGDGIFKETVTARSFVATTGATIPTLSATTINDVHKDHYTKNDAIADNTGWGVISGLDGIAFGGELHVDPGVAYTKSGRRVELKVRQKVNMIGAPVGGNRYDVLYIKGPGSSTEEGNLHCLEGVVGQSAAQSLANPILADGVILATVKREIAQASITQSDIDNAVRDSGTIAGRKPLYVEDATKHVKVRYELHANKLKEGGQYLNTLYATLAGGNTFTSNQKFDGRVHINATGTLGLNPTSGNYALRVGTDSSYIAMDSNEILATSDLHVYAVTSLRLKGSSVELEGKVKASSNATTVTIPAGQTSVTWTHGYGSTSYAVNLTSNSFERHIRWTSKGSNTVVIELDDPSTQETLVDCILIGY